MLFLTTSVNRCLKLNFQGYIALFNFQSAATFRWRLIIYHSSFRFSSGILKFFWDFLSASVFQRPEPFKTAWSLIYHKNWFCQTQFLIFFCFFISLFYLLLNIRRRKTSHNISSQSDLSNHFEQKKRKNLRFFALNAQARARRVCTGVQAGVFCVLDGSCGTQVRVVDATLGIMGFMGAVWIMGNSWSVIGWQFGFACRNGDGRLDTGTVQCFFKLINHPYILFKDIWS